MASSRLLNQKKDHPTLYEKVLKPEAIVVGIFVAILTILIQVTYIFGSTRLKFPRDFGIETTDFNYPLVNDYNTLKWYFIVFVPQIISWFPPLFLLICLAFWPKHVPKQKMNEEDVDLAKGLHMLHVVISLLALVAFVMSIIYLGIDWTTCNQKQSGGHNVCSNIKLPCAIDYFTAPGKPTGYSYIQSCGITPTYSMAQLDKDPYFLTTFIAAVIMIPMMGFHVALIFVLLKDVPVKQ
jgi:hypothetical protein